MSRNPIDKYRKCTSKKPWKNEDKAWEQARAIMRHDLRQGFVHVMTVYRCKYSDDSDPHYHVGTLRKPFAVGSVGWLDVSGWAKELGIKWTKEDDAIYQRSKDSEQVRQSYWRRRRERDST